MQIYPTKTDTVSQFWREKYECEARKNWDLFYKRHSDKFFKDRHYLHREWGKYLTPSSQKGEATAEAADATMEGHYAAIRQGKNMDTRPKKHNGKVILEVGCGVGNTVFPLLEDDPEAIVYACDFSERAVKLLKAHESYDEKRVHASVHDITASDLLLNVPANAVDVITLVFVLSAISPEKMPAAIRNILKVLKCGGHILFRDYAAGDLAQERFMTKEQRISENFYVRGDGTRAYYFTEDNLKVLFEAEGLVCQEMKIHNREITNKARELVMNRRWIQAVFQYGATSMREPDTTNIVGVSRTGSEADGSTQGENAGRQSPVLSGKSCRTLVQNVVELNAEECACLTCLASSVEPRTDGISFRKAGSGDQSEGLSREDDKTLSDKEVALVPMNVDLLDRSGTRHVHNGHLECSGGLEMGGPGIGLEENFLPTLFAEPVNYEEEEVDVLCERVRLKMLPKENQHTQHNTGLLMWHSAPALATFLSVNPSLVCDKTVVELGCGTAALSSFIVSKNCRRIVATDGDTKTMTLVGENVVLNRDGFPVDKIACRQLRWGNWEDVRLVKREALEEGERGHFDVVLGSDVVYVSEAVPLLFKTARALLKDGDANLEVINEGIMQDMCHTGSRKGVKSMIKKANESEEAGLIEEMLPAKEEDGPQGPFLLLCHITRGVSERFIISCAQESGFHKYKALSWKEAWEKSFISDKVRAAEGYLDAIEALSGCLRLLWFW